MAKDTFYFTHDFGARNDPKMINLQIKYGMSGIGCYWCLVEMLFEEGGEVPLEYERLSFSLRMDTNIVRSIIEDFGLFIFSDNMISSNSVLKRIRIRNEKSLKAKESINLRWNKYKNNTAVLRTDSNVSFSDSFVPVIHTIKEKKENETKEKENKVLYSGNFETEISNTNSIQSVSDNTNVSKKHASQVMQRKNTFRSKIDTLLSTTHNRYAFFDDEINNFFSYWAELNKSETKMRFELQKTFEIGLRLENWMKNSHKFSNQHSGNQEDKTSRMLRIAKEQTELATKRIQQQENQQFHNSEM